MRLTDFISKVDKNIFLDIELPNGDLVYFGKAGNYLFDERDNGYFVDFFDVNYYGNFKFVLEVIVVC